MLPLLYHAHHCQNNEDLVFWQELAAQSGDPILELGCGTGRVLLYLANQGYTIFGVDYDLEMLKFLRRNLSSELPVSCSQHAYIFQANFAHLHLALRFKLIIMPCNTYSTLSNHTRQSSLAMIQQHLQPGGRFAFSIPNPALLQKLPAYSDSELETIFTHPLSGEPVQVSSAWQREHGYFTVTWHYDHLLPNGQVERTSVQARHHLIPLQDYLDELHKTGLKVITIYGEYDFSAYTKESSHAIIIARKQDIDH